MTMPRRFSRHARALKKIDRKNSFDEQQSSIDASIDPGGDVGPGGAPPGNDGNSDRRASEVSDSDHPGPTTGIAGTVDVPPGGSATNGGSDRGGKLRKIGKMVKVVEEMPGSPSHNYQQQYPHGYPVPGYPPGMPMQPVMAPPGMVPYMMPQPYYNYAAHYGGSPYDGGSPYTERSPYTEGSPYDYSCGRRSDDKDGGGCDISLSTFESSCATMLKPCEGLAKLVLKTVDSVANSCHFVMDYGDLICDPADGRLRSTPQDHAELLEKIDKLHKLVTETEASGDAVEKTKDLNPLEVLNKSAITQHSQSSPQDHAELLGKIDKLYQLVTQKEASGEAITKTEDMNPLEALNKSASTHHSQSSPQDHAELLEKINNIRKLMTEKETSDETTKKKNATDFNPLNDSFIDHFQGFSDEAKENVAPCVVKAEERGDNVEGLTSFFSIAHIDRITLIQDVSLNESVEAEADFKDSTKTQPKLYLGQSRSRDRRSMKYLPVTLSQYNILGESVEAEDGFEDSKNIQPKILLGEQRSREPLMKHIPLKSCLAKEEKFTVRKKPPFSLASLSKKPLKTSQVKKEKVTIQKEPSVDSLGFPQASLWETNFGNSNAFTGEGVRCVPSPVSVTTSLETQSCTWCGLGGNNSEDAKKLKLCSACQSTYYCSSECQSKDWTNGHATTCKPVSNVD